MIDCYGIRVGVTRARPLTCCLVYKKLLVVQERVITIFTKQLQRVRRFGTIGLLGNLIKHISGLSDECQENSIPNIFSNSVFKQISSSGRINFYPKVNTLSYLICNLLGLAQLKSDGSIEEKMNAIVKEVDVK